jgi:hypothetical protein
MIDNFEQVERLLPKLEASLPLRATLSPELAAFIREEMQAHDVTRQCEIVSISYAGYSGGIMCRFVLPGPNEARAFHVSITHLTFDPRHALAREIAAYQKHRIKRMRIEDADRPSQGRRSVVIYNNQHVS